MNMNSGMGFPYQIINLGSLQHTTSDNEMTKIKKVYILLFSDIYKIQIVQKIVRLSSKGRFNQPSLFLIH